MTRSEELRRKAQGRFRQPEKSEEKALDARSLKQQAVVTEMLRLRTLRLAKQNQETPPLAADEKVKPTGPAPTEHE